MNNLYIDVFSLCIGMCAGSAMMCLGERAGRHSSWFKGRSRCNICDHVLSWNELIPVVSFLMQKGKCRHCHNRISLAYPIMELISGILFLLIVKKNGGLNIITIRDWVFAAVLISISACDMVSMEIPDALSMTIFVISLFTIGHNTHFIREFWIRVLQSLGLAGEVLIVSLLMRLIRKQEMIGIGDIILLFVIGMYLGLGKGMLALVIACLCGIVFVLLLRSRRIPFAPSLAIGAMIALLL